MEGLSKLDSMEGEMAACEWHLRAHSLMVNFTGQCERRMACSNITVLGVPGGDEHLNPLTEESRWLSLMRVGLHLSSRRPD